MTQQPTPPNELERLNPSPGSDDDSESTVVSKKPPQHWGGGGVDWRKVGELLLGRQLGSFRLESLLGTGGMGAVFQATDLQLDRQVAVKVINSDEDDPEANRRFRVEAQSAARLDHQNIARVFHVGQDQGWNFIVLELVAGQTLRQLVTAGGPLTLSAAVHLFRQLASALGHAHRREIIHRDIKPSNVLVTEDGVVKIVDMGLARIQRSPDSAHLDQEEGMTLGTFDYIAPEQARDPRQADQQSDLYSLGCTLYYALAGRPPFEGTTIEKILCHSSSPRPKVTDVRPDLPPAVDALVGRLMAPRKEDRLATASELETELALLLKKAPKPARMASTTFSQPSKARFPVAVIAVTAVLLSLSFLVETNWQATGNSLPEWPPDPDYPVALESGSGTSLLNLEANVNRDANRAETAKNGFEPPMASNGETGAKTRPGVERGISNFSPTTAPSQLGDTPFRYQTPSLFWGSFPLLSGADGSESTSQPWWIFNDGDTTGQPASPVLPAPPRNGAAMRTESEQITTIQVVPPESTGFGRTPGISANESVARSRQNVWTVASLEEAVNQLTRFPNVHTIELAFDGVHLVPTIRIPAGGLREIHAAPGFRPVLRFRRSEIEDSPSLLLEGGSLEISGLDVVWETGKRWETGKQAGLAPACWLEVPSLDRVVFQNCSFTHVVASEVTPTPVSQRPAWFYVNTLPISVMGGQKRGVLQCSQSAFRGQSDILHARYAHPLLMRFAQCWVATRGSAFQLGGKLPGPATPGLEIELEHCTWLTQFGLVQSQQSAGRSHSDFTIFAENCILAVLDPGTGLIEHSQVTNTPLTEPPFYFDGFNNVFIAKLIWSQTHLESGPMVTADFARSLNMRWFQQDLARDLSDTYLLSQDKLRTLLQNATHQLEPAQVGSIWGPELQEHGADTTRVPPFPTRIN